MTRRRILGIVALVVIVAAIALLGYSGWRGSGAAADARPGLTLLINLRSRIEVTAGTPLVFQVSLGSSASSPAFRVGSSRRPWHTLIRLEGGTGGSPPLAPSRIEPARSVHLTHLPDGRTEVTDDSGAVAHLEAGSHVHTVSYVMEPAETARLTPGTYRFRAVLETPFWMRAGWTGRAISAVAVVDVRDPSLNDARTEALEAERFADTAGFYLGIGRFAEAQQAATALVSVRPTEPRSHVLLGDALAELGRRHDALESYRRAMSLVRSLPEEPTPLIERIERARKIEERTPREELR